MRPQWLIAGVVTFAILGTLAFQDAGEQGQSQGEEPAATAAADPRAQPIAFPHDTHAGDGEGQFGIDCQYCHFSAERSVDAGLPTVATCWGCHQIVQGRNNPEEVAKIREYQTGGEPIPWVRIYKVADHVNFPHMRHIAAEVDCTECHGQVQEMEVIEEVAQPLAMGWCVTCHQEQEASVDCSVCHY